MPKSTCTTRHKALHQRQSSYSPEKKSSNATYLTRTRAYRKNQPESPPGSTDFGPPVKKSKYHKGQTDSFDLDPKTGMMTSKTMNLTQRRRLRKMNRLCEENKSKEYEICSECNPEKCPEKKPPDPPEESLTVDDQLIKEEFHLGNTTRPAFVDYASIPGQSQAPDPMDVDPLALPALNPLQEPIINRPELPTTTSPSVLPANYSATSADLTSNQPKRQTGLITNIENENVTDQSQKQVTKIVFNIPIDSIEPSNEINPMTIQDIIIPNSMQTSIAENSSETMSVDLDEKLPEPYRDYYRHKAAYDQYVQKFVNNFYGYICLSCNRLFFKNDLEPPEYTSFTRKFIERWFKDWRRHFQIERLRFCKSCKKSLANESEPAFFRYHGFQYPIFTRKLPKLDPISARLIAPVLPFLQIRRLHYTPEKDGTVAQVINVPISLDTMVNKLPRNLDDDYCININLKENKVYESRELAPLVNKKHVKAWLRYLIKTPLYKIFPMEFNEHFFDYEDPNRGTVMQQVCERISDDNNLIALQQTLLWSDVKYLQLGHTPMNLPMNMMDYIEELCFPTIYVGQPRSFIGKGKVEPFMVTMSEIKRSDRRGVTPDHLVYMAIKIMRLRIRDFLENTCKYFEKNTGITRSDIQSDSFITNSFESNLAFLRSIPNSTWYWSERKKDLFAMIRQLGIPTLYLSVTANEVGWNDLLQMLYRLHHDSVRLSLAQINDLRAWEKSVLVNNDAVICAIYFNKLIDVLMDVLQSNTSLNDRYVLHYFRTVDFKHTGSPKMHILLWLSAKNSRESINIHKEDKVALINDIISLEPENSCGFMNLQLHQHSFACFKEAWGNPGAPRDCRHGAPFMPSSSTVILEPMSNSTPGFAKYSQRYFKIRENLKTTEYPDMVTFYEQNGILSDEHYLDVLRAGIDRETVFIKREPHDKWTTAFNPFILNIVKATMEIQFITEEHSCASFVVDFVNKTNRGISELKHKLLRLKEEHPDFSMDQLAHSISIDLLNSVEITSQEAAWYLLQEPMSKSSVDVVYVPTEQPSERIRLKKDAKNTEGLVGYEDVDDFSDPWNKYVSYGQDWFKMYETRPYEMEDMTLADFVIRFEFSLTDRFDERRNQCLIRYRNYDINAQFTEYRREMVTLHWPFRNEASDIIEDMKFMCIYHEFEELIQQRHKKLEPDVEVVQKINEICDALCRIEGIPDDEADELNLTRHLRSHLLQNSVINGGNLAERNSWTTPPVIDLDTDTDTATERSDEKDDDVELIENRDEDDEATIEEQNLIESDSIDDEVTFEEEKLIESDSIVEEVTIEEQKLLECDLIDSEVKVEDQKFINSDLKSDELMIEDFVKNDEIAVEETKTINQTA